jgi:putative ABC transport system permease protein
MIADLRLAARGLLRAKGLAVAAVLCLALGIAATTIVYSVTSAIVLHPVPTPDATNLVMVAEVPPSHPSVDAASMAPANYLDLAQRNHSFSELAAFRPLEASLTGIDESERVNGYRVTPSYFHLLRVQSVLGRVFTDEDAHYAGSPDVVILSDGLWHRHFGADPGVIGRVVRINDVPRTIVGVMPPGFVFPSGAELWTPQSMDGDFGRERDGRVLTGVLARLRPGVSLARARADVKGIMQQLAQDYPEDDGKWDMRVERANDFYGQHQRPFMLAQLAAVVLVLLLACANVANLLLARATTRAREIAVRVALGASRARIVRLQLAEALLIAVTSGALGALLAIWGVAAVRTMLPGELVSFNPGWTRMDVSGAVLAFTGLVSIATALIVGAVPAFVASGADPQHALSDAGRGGSEGMGRHRLRGWLVAAEMALALTMIAGTMVTVRGFAALARQAPGYRVDRALTMQLTAPIARYRSEADAERMYEGVLDRLRAEPGVVNAAYSTALPPEYSDHGDRIFLEGEPRPTRSDPARTPRSRIVSPAYFAAMDIPLINGRSFTIHDDSTAPRVIVVSDAMARAYWPGGNAIGKRIGVAGDDTTMATVIGVVGDVRYNPNLGQASLAPAYYLPLAQAHPWRTMSLVVRTTTDPAAMAHQIQHAIATVAPTVAPGSVLTLEHLYDSSLAPQRITGQMMAAFAVIALLLAALGIHGVLSYTVAQRTHDIGVRTALGARPADIVRSTLGGAMRPVGAGIVIGLLGALAMTRGLAHLLTQLSANDPVSFAAAVVVLAAAALAGSYVPARRAIKVDPLVALRSNG